MKKHKPKTKIEFTSKPKLEFINKFENLEDVNRKHEYMLKILEFA